jgi:hypothetical protein
MRAWLSVGLVAVLGLGCASVRVVRRDGCWVKQTERWPNRISEDLGPCDRPSPQWSEDRLARLVQECIAQTDYRWQGAALQAWSRGERLPPQPRMEEVVSACMNNPATAMVGETEGLRGRLAEVAMDREGLRQVVERGGEHLRGSHDRIADALGEAAKKPAPAAIATATSNGSATTHSDLQSKSDLQSPTGVTVSPPPAAPSRSRPALKRPALTLAPSPACPPEQKGEGGSGAEGQVAATPAPGSSGSATPGQVAVSAPSAKEAAQPPPVVPSLPDAEPGAN